VQGLHVLDALLEFVRHTAFFGHLAADAPGSGLVQRRVKVAEHRCDEHSSVLRFELVAGLLVQQRGVVDHVDAMAQAHLHRFRAARMRGNALAVRLRHVAYRGDLGIVHHSGIGRGSRRAGVARDIDLQRIDALAHHFAREAAELFGAIADHGEILAVHVIQAHIAEAGGDRHFGTGVVVAGRGNRRSRWHCAKRCPAGAWPRPR